MHGEQSASRLHAIGEDNSSEIDHSSAVADLKPMKGSNNNLNELLVDSEESDNNSDWNGEEAIAQESENELFGLDENSSATECLQVLTQQAIPVVITFFLTVGGTFINLVFASHYVEDNSQSVVFAGVSLSNMFANVSGLSILIGMTTAVETLGSQHNGAGNYREVGVVLQRSLLILSTLCLPILVLWLVSYDIFLALGVEHDVCVVIRNFMRIRTLTMPMDVFIESYEKYLMSIGVMRPSMWSNIAFNVLIFSFNCLFVYGMKLDYECLAWSWVLSTYLGGVVQIVLSWNYPAVQRTLQPFTMDAFKNWPEFIMLGLPGTVMLCSEWWAFEILTIFASVLGTAEVAAQTIILQTASLAFMIPLGIGVATTSLVGNSIGAGKKSLAVRVGKYSISAISIVGIFAGSCILLFGNSFIALFTEDTDVRHLASSALFFLSLFTLIDGLQAVCSGVLRGAGKQAIGAVANVFAYYVIGLPMAWVFCFVFKLSLVGLMFGISLATGFQVTVMLTLIFGFEEYLYSKSDVTGGAEASRSIGGFSILSNLDDDTDLEKNQISSTELTIIRKVDSPSPTGVTDMSVPLTVKL